MEIFYTLTAGFVATFFATKLYEKTTQTKVNPSFYLFGAGLSLFYLLGVNSIEKIQPINGMFASLGMGFLQALCLTFIFAIYRTKNKTTKPKVLASFFSAQLLYSFILGVFLYISHGGTANLAEINPKASMIVSSLAVFSIYFFVFCGFLGYIGYKFLADQRR